MRSRTFEFTPPTFHAASSDGGSGCSGSSGRPGSSGGPQGPASPGGPSGASGSPEPPEPPELETNAFDPAFLERKGFEELQPGELTVDEVVLEATLSGPWRVVPAPLKHEGDPLMGWGCQAAGALRPYAVFRERRMALLAAAILPALAFCDELVLVNVKAQGQPFSICRRGPRGARTTEPGPQVGRMDLWHPELPKALGWLLHLARKPAMLAPLLEALPAETLERAGRLVRGRVEEDGG